MSIEDGLRHSRRIFSVRGCQGAMFVAARMIPWDSRRKNKSSCGRPRQFLAQLLIKSSGYDLQDSAGQITDDSRPAAQHGEGFPTSCLASAWMRWNVTLPTKTGRVRLRRLDFSYMPYFASDAQGVGWLGGGNTTPLFP